MSDKKLVGFIPQSSVTPEGSPYANGSPAQANTEAQVTAASEAFLNDGPSSTLNLAQKQVVLHVDYTDIKAVATAYLGPVFPVGTMVTRAFYRVLTTFTSATDAATIGIGFATDDANGIVAATAISAGGNIWDAGATPNHECIQDGAAANFGELLTAARQLQFTRGGAEVLTAGKLVLVVEYVVVS